MFAWTCTAVTPIASINYYKAVLGECGPLTKAVMVNLSEMVLTMYNFSLPEVYVGMELTTTKHQAAAVKAISEATEKAMVKAEHPSASHKGGGIPRSILRRWVTPLSILLGPAMVVYTTMARGSISSVLVGAAMR